jgi:hypothetical protein
MPVIFMSGYAPEQAPAAPGSFGVLLRKPFSATELLGALREHLA